MTAVKYTTKNNLQAIIARSTERPEYVAKVNGETYRFHKISHDLQDVKNYLDKIIR